MVPTSIDYCEILQNFVGNIPALLKFVRKTPTHDTKFKKFFYSIGIISTSVGIILPHIATIPTLVGIVHSCRNYSYTLRHV